MAGFGLSSADKHVTPSRERMILAVSALPQLQCTPMILHGLCEVVIEKSKLAAYRVSSCPVIVIHIECSIKLLESDLQMLFAIFPVLLIEIQRGKIDISSGQAFMIAALLED